MAGAAVRADRRRGGRAVGRGDDEVPVPVRDGGGFRGPGRGRGREMFGAGRVPGRAGEGRVPAAEPSHGHDQRTDDRDGERRRRHPARPAPGARYPSAFAVHERRP